jgi:hypothetical protein
MGQAWLKTNDTDTDNDRIKDGDEDDDNSGPFLCVRSLATIAPRGKQTFLHSQEALA